MAINTQLKTMLLTSERLLFWRIILQKRLVSHTSLKLRRHCCVLYKFYLKQPEVEVTLSAFMDTRLFSFHFIYLFPVLFINWQFFFCVYTKHVQLVRGYKRLEVVYCYRNLWPLSFCEVLMQTKTKTCMATFIIRFMKASRTLEVYTWS